MFSLGTAIADSKASASVNITLDAKPKLQSVNIRNKLENSQFHAISQTLTQNTPITSVPVEEYICESIAHTINQNQAQNM